MNTSLRLGLSTVSLAAMLALAGCAGAAPEAPVPDSATPTVETTPEAPAVQTACPDGFIEAYKAASTAYSADTTFTEVAAADFKPQSLAGFLDGGCAIHISGTANFGGGDVAVESDTGFNTKDVAAEIIAVLEGEGYKGDGSGMTFTRDTPFGYAQVIVPSDTVGTNGDAAVKKYYLGGTVFNAS